MTAHDPMDDPNFRSWFEGSKAVDREGRPLLVFRGEHGKRNQQAFQTRHGAISFGDLKAAKIYASDPNDHGDKVHRPRIMPAYLSIRRPIVHDEGDPFVDLRHLAETLGRDEAMRIAVKFASDVEDTGHWYEMSWEIRAMGVEEFLKRDPARLDDLYFHAFRYLNDADEVARLKAVGFDGAIHCGFGDNGTDAEYKVFDASQIRCASKCWLALDEVDDFVAALTAAEPFPAMSGP